MPPPRSNSKFPVSQPWKWSGFPRNRQTQRQNGSPEIPSPAKRLKTTASVPAKAESTDRLSFQNLVTVLQPDGSSQSSSWKSIVDLEEQVVGFFLIDYKHFIPRLSKCVRIQRDRSMSAQESLIPSVFFGNTLDHSFAQNTLGRPYLTSFDDLQTLLNQVSGAKRREAKPDVAPVEKIKSTVKSAVDNKKDAYESEDDEIVPFKFDLTNGNTLPNFLPEVDFLDFLPPHSDGNDDEEEDLYLQASPKKHISHETETEQDGLKSMSFIQIEDDEQQEDMEDDEDETMLQVFRNIPPGDTHSPPGPELACQTPALGRSVITAKGFNGVNLYVNTNQLLQLQKDFQNEPNVYLRKLTDKLLGPAGLNFVSERRRLAVGSGPKELLTRSFIAILEAHMEEVGIMMRSQLIVQAIADHWTNIFGASRKRPQAANLEPASRSKTKSKRKVSKLVKIPKAAKTLRTVKVPKVAKIATVAKEAEVVEKVDFDNVAEIDEAGAVAEVDGEAEVFDAGENGSTKCFVDMDAPQLPSEKPGKAKVPVNIMDEDYSALEMYLEEHDVKRLKRCGKKDAPRYFSKLFWALMGDEGRNLIEKKCFELRREDGEAEVDGNRRKRKLSTVEVKSVFTPAFMDTMRVHLDQNNVLLSEDQMEKRLSDILN